MQKTILLTGVSRGLGRALCEGFVEQGHVVVGCARDLAAIGELERLYGEPHRFAAVDLADSVAVDQWAAETHEAGVVPDLIVNNAGIMNEPAPLWKIPPDEFAALLQVNIAGVYHVLRAFLPAMIARSVGTVVNFSSTWGSSTSPEVAPYCATKWAIEGLTQALAQELPGAMAAVALNPGVINTDMLKKCFGTSADAYPAPGQWAESAVPFILRLGSADNGAVVRVPGM